MVGAAPDFDPARAPDDPVELFVQWLRHAIDSGVTEPHAMTLSTVGVTAAGPRPSARVLILKDVDAAGWHFAISSASRKGAELDRNPAVALTFYWAMLGRQIRVDGTVRADPAQVTADDFLARSEGARAMVLTGRQSEPYCDPAEISEALAKAQRELQESPGLVPPGVDVVFGPGRHARVLAVRPRAPTPQAAVRTRPDELVPDPAVALRRPQPNRDGSSSTSPSRRRYSHGMTGMARVIAPASP